MKSPALAFPAAAGAILLLASSWLGAAPAETPVAAPDGLAAGFANPPDSAKPRTWWHWVAGNVSSEGITADLKAMKEIGLGGAQIFTVEQSDIKGPVVFMSPEWRRLVRQAITEADRLGLELAIENCEGWSESGGPWVPPAQAMQRVVWTQTAVTGGRRIALAPAQPTVTRGYYRDMAVLAYPTLPDDAPASPVRISTPEGPAGAVIRLPSPTPGHPQWVRLDFADLRTFRSLRLSGRMRLHYWSGSPQAELQASDDGINFHRVCEVRDPGTTSFDAATGRSFRLWLAVEQPPKAPLEITEISLGGPRIDRADARSGMAADESVNEASASSFPAADIIPSPAIVDLSGKSEWDAPAGEWTIVRIGHTPTGITNHPASAATEGLECDKMSAAAVGSHIANGMLGAVVADGGPLIGRGLRYILCDSWEAGCENWTPLIREEFSRRRGYDLGPWLLALTGRVVGSEDLTRRFLWDYRRTLADLVAENHYGVLQRFAHRNGMGLYAEAVGIGMPTVADQLQCKGCTDVPMGEFWVNRWAPPGTPVDDTKEAASAAHIFGRPVAAAEAFTSQAEFAGWSVDPWSLKELGDREFCLGINRFVMHRYAHQPWLDRRPGMSMGPWGINFERTNTWWDPGAAWISYLSRCEYLLQQGSFAADLCYFYGEGAPVSVRTERLSPEPPAGYDYDVCDAGTLMRMSVRDGRVTLPSGMSYRVLVLPRSEAMSLPVLGKIRDLVEAGATVEGPRPLRTPGLTGYPGSESSLRSLAGEVWGNCDGLGVREHRLGKGRVCLGGPLPAMTGVAPDFESDQGNLRFIHRRADGAEIYFVANPDRRELVARCTFRVDGLAPEFWHPDTGAMERPAIFSRRDGRTTVSLHLDPWGSAFVLFRTPAGPGGVIASVAEIRSLFPGAGTDAAAPACEPPVVRDGRVVLTSWEPARYRFTTLDGAVLEASAEDMAAPLRIGGSWDISFPSGLGAPPAITFDHLMSWTESAEDGVKYFSGTATYRKDIALPAGLFGPGGRVFLDLGSVRNLARVNVNGADLGVLWKEPFRVEITAAAHPGVNHVEIRVTNLWPNRMIGDLSQPADRRVTWASVEPYTKTSPLLPSGLLGPVIIRPARDLTPRPVRAAP